MANTLRLKRSAVPAQIPTTAQLELGEVAINTNDGKMYIKKDDGVAAIVEIGGAGGAASNTYKEAVRAATTANIALNGNVVLDGITTAAGERILVKNQTTASNNGIYVASAGAWTRATDFDTTGPEVANGAVIPVQFGSINGGTVWQLVSQGGSIGNNFVFSPLSGIATSNSSTWTTPTASNTNSFSIGSNARATGSISIAIGNNANASNTQGLAIGTSANTAGANAISIGTSSIANASGAVAVGHNSTTGSVADGVAIGRAASVSGSTSAGPVAIGRNSIANSSGISIAIGDAAFASYADVINIGSFNGTGIRERSIIIGTIAGAAGSGERAGIIVLGLQARHWSPACHTTIIGHQGSTDFTGETTFSNGSFTTTGDCKISVLAMRIVTSNATATELSTGFASTTTNISASPTERLVLSGDSSYIFDCDIIARNTATDTESKAWNVKFAIRRGTNAASTTLIGTPTVTLFGEDTGTTAWAVGVTADTTNGRPNISVTGEAAKTIRWVANIRMTKVSG